VRLPDFAFPSGTLPAILSRSAEFNSYIEKVNAENFVAVGVSGEGEPQVLPGILDSIEVSDSLLVDDAEMSDKSGSVKIISGWSDSDITINLLLIDIPKATNEAVVPNITRFDCLKQITSVFKQMKDGAPRVYTIAHPHIAAWGLREFIFNGLKSSESRGKRIISCSLEFDEFDSVSGKSQDRALGASVAMESPAVISQDPEVPEETKREFGAQEAKYVE
jgi:hypothetical protein